MKPQVIPRFCINGKYYRPDEISEKQLRQILEKRLEKAMEAICYKRKSWVTFPVYSRNMRSKETGMLFSQGDFIQIDFQCTGDAKHIGKLKKYIFV